MWNARQRPQRYGRLKVKLPKRLAIPAIACCASRTVAYRVFVQVLRFTPTPFGSTPRLPGISRT